MLISRALLIKLFLMSFFVQSHRKTGFDTITTPSPGLSSLTQVSTKQPLLTIREDMLLPLSVLHRPSAGFLRLRRRRKAQFHSEWEGISSRSSWSMIPISKSSLSSKFHQSSSQERSGSTSPPCLNSPAQDSTTSKVKLYARLRPHHRHKLSVTSHFPPRPQYPPYPLTTWALRKMTTIR